MTGPAHNSTSTPADSLAPESPQPAPMRTRATELLGIRFPIVQGGLAHLSFFGLAAAVSLAGGLGQIGVACFDEPEELRADIRRLRARTAEAGQPDAPFGVNFPIGHRNLDGFLAVALEERAPVISITAGNPEAMLRAIQQSGVAPLPKTLILVAGVRAARKAQELGADAVIAVGYDGGGHLGRDDVGTFALVPRIVESVAIPVLASGGVVDGHGLAAALALGADGVEMGTRFVATQECVASQAYKDALVAASETETAIIERSLGRPGRALRGRVVAEIQAREAELAQRNASPDETLATLLPYILGGVNKTAAIDGHMDDGFVWAGQGVGQIHDIPTAGDLITRMAREARDSLARLRAAVE